MPVIPTPDNESLGARRGEVIVCIPVYGGHEHFASCLRSVIAHTSRGVPVLICDDASPDYRSEALVRGLQREHSDGPQLYYHRRARNLGFPANVNAAFAVTAPADMVILNSDCVVAKGWLDGLRSAAYSDSTVATATALTNHGSVVSVPDREPTLGLPEGWTVESAAAAVGSRALGIRPHLPTAIGHCVYVRRTALELVGDFDLAFTPGYGEEVDFSQRCLRSGLSHVVADEVYVLHYGSGSFAAAGQPSPSQTDHEEILATRYPYYHQAVGTLRKSPTAPLARSLSAARRAMLGLSVAVDARILAGAMTGTQLHVLELVAALARTGAVRVATIVQAQLSDYAREILDGLPGVDLVTVASDAPAPPTVEADLVHRPFQIASPSDLGFVSQLGERVVITHQDMISYRNPAYFRSYRAWEGYRQLTRRALAAADRVLFFSEHARHDALREDLVDQERASVIHIGVDHTITRAPRAPAPPKQAHALPVGAEVMLCIGTDFRHKNRIFALRVAEELQRRHGWTGRLVYAGPRVALGSSIPDEQRMLAERPQLREAVLDVGEVSEAEKLWLLKRAGLVIYPTVHEGFGLVPFEAADRDVPCLWAPGTSLSEILPEAAAGILPWDAGATADAALALLRDEAAGARNVAAIREAGRELQWDRTAARLIELYNETCDRPPTPASASERSPEGLMRGGLSEDAIRLVGPEGALPRELERPLLALATHRRIATPIFRAIRAGYRVSYRWRRTGLSGAEHPEP